VFSQLAYLRVVDKFAVSLSPLVESYGVAFMNSAITHFTVPSMAPISMVNGCVCFTSVVRAFLHFSVSLGDNFTLLVQRTVSCDHSL
jgi:hypothetical protein